jgi:hypothetical protein
MLPGVAFRLPPATRLISLRDVAGAAVVVIMPIWSHSFRTALHRARPGIFIPCRG